MASVSSGARVQTELTKISSRVDGTVDRILVKEGDRVKAGQMLIRLVDEDITLNIDALRADIALEEARRKRLVSEKFYDGIVFHRVIAGFMAQTGDPDGNGTGGSKYKDLPAEFTNYKYRRGTVGAARTQNPNSANSQFFICFNDTGCAHLTGQYTVWGQVIEGMENVDKIERGEPPANPDSMTTVRVAADVTGG